MRGVRSHGTRTLGSSRPSTVTVDVLGSSSLPTCSDLIVATPSKQACAVIVVFVFVVTPSSCSTLQNQRPTRPPPRVQHDPPPPVQRRVPPPLDHATQSEVHPQPHADRRAQVRPSPVRVGDEHGAVAGVPLRGGAGSVLDEALQPQKPPLALHPPHQLFHQQEVRVFPGVRGFSTC